MTPITGKQQRAAEDLEWDVIARYDDKTHELKGYEFNNYSPAGEDISFEICADMSGFIDDIVSTVQKVADCFDVDEHVELWIDSRGEFGVPNSICALVEDSEAIKQMLNDLAKAIREAT